MPKTFLHKVTDELYIIYDKSVGYDYVLSYGRNKKEAWSNALRRLEGHNNPLNVGN